MKKLVLWINALLLAGVSMVALADEQPGPDTLISSTVSEVLDVVRKDKALRNGDKQKVLALVEEKVLPHFDFNRMTQLAVGKNWRKATPEQKQALVTEFRGMLVRTYTKAFTSYRDQSVEVKPFSMASGATEATVKTLITKPGGQPIPVDYEMWKTNDGWKAYDLSVDGVSLVTSYRSTFNDQIQQAGIDGLIKMLADKNLAASKSSEK